MAVMRHQTPHRSTCSPKSSLSFCFSFGLGLVHCLLFFLYLFFFSSVTFVGQSTALNPKTPVILTISFCRCCAFVVSSDNSRNIIALLLVWIVKGLPKKLHWHGPQRFCSGFVWRFYGRSAETMARKLQEIMGMLPLLRSISVALSRSVCGWEWFMRLTWIKRGMPFSQSA